MRRLHVNLSVCISGALFIFGLFIFISSLKMRYWSGYGPGEGFVSTWSSGLLSLLSGISIFTSMQDEGLKLSDVFPKGKGLYNIVVTIAGVILFLLLVMPLGFCVSSFLMLSILLSRGYKWSYAMAIAAFVTIVCFISFTVFLQVPVPVNKFGW